MNDANQTDTVSEGKHTPDLPLIAEGRFVRDPNSAFRDQTVVECYAPDSAKMAQRIVACINSLAGIPDPERAIAEAREALADSIRVMDSQSHACECGKCVSCRAKAALGLLTAR